MDWGTSLVYLMPITGVAVALFVCVAVWTSIWNRRHAEHGEWIEKAA